MYINIFNIAIGIWNDDGYFGASDKREAPMEQVICFALLVLLLLVCVKK